MKWIAPASFVLIAAAARTTIFFVSALKPTGTGAFVFFAACLILPYEINLAARFLP